MSAFVQISLDYYEARQRGDLSGGAYCLGLHLAGEANYFTRRTTVTLERLIEDLEAGCSPETMRRRLVELRAGGFIVYESHSGQRRGYAIEVTGRLIYGANLLEPPHDLHTEDPLHEEVTSTTTSTAGAERSAAITDDTDASGLPRPPREPPREGVLQEREKPSTPKPSTTQTLVGEQLPAPSALRWWEHPLFGNPDGTPPLGMSRGALARSYSLDEVLGERTVEQGLAEGILLAAPVG